MRPLATALCLLPAAASFSVVRHSRCNSSPLIDAPKMCINASRGRYKRSARDFRAMRMADNGMDVSRRGILSKSASAAAAAAFSNVVTNAEPAAAITAEPTRIELLVETDYLIHTLDFFDGDMRKVLGVVIRSPFTKVRIDPPNKKGSDGRAADVTPRDAILRALYSYDAPEDYAAQASWVQVDEKGSSFVDLLTRKRYTISIGNREEGGMSKITISLSNLEAGMGAGILSYPLAFAFYNYESYREEQEKAAKKEARLLKYNSEWKENKEKAAAAAAAKKEKVKEMPKESLPAEQVAESAGEELKAQTDTRGAPEASFVASVTPLDDRVDRPPTAGKPVSVPADNKTGAESATDTIVATYDVTPPIAGGSSNDGVDNATSSFEQQYATSLAAASTKTKQTSSGGMDAYAAQMAALMAANEPNLTPASSDSYLFEPRVETNEEEPRQSLSTTGGYLDNL